MIHKPDPTYKLLKKINFLVLPEQSQGDEDLDFRYIYVSPFVLTLARS